MVASAITNGTLSMRASVCASSVLPEPVGPISRMLLLASSTSSFLAAMCLQALVVVVDRDRQDALGGLLADHVLVEAGLDLAAASAGRTCAPSRAVVAGGHFVADDVVAQLDALVADEHRRAGDQLLHLVLALAAERAVEQLSRWRSLFSRPWSRNAASTGMLTMIAK